MNCNTSSNMSQKPCRSSTDNEPSVAIDIDQNDVIK